MLIYSKTKSLPNLTVYQLAVIDTAILDVSNRGRSLFHSQFGMSHKFFWMSLSLWPKQVNNIQTIPQEKEKWSQGVSLLSSKLIIFWGHEEGLFISFAILI